MNPAGHRLLAHVAALLALLASGLATQAEQIVFAEVMHSPPRNLPAWIEVWNQTATPFDIARWRLTGNIDFTFPEFSATNAADSLDRKSTRLNSSH